MPPLPPTLNACFNALSAVLLVCGYRMIKQRRIQAHRACMLGAVASSACFLAGYLYYHFRVGDVVYRG
ncbi:MAG: DUF420 domain-containing protein, partial [Elusimicrobia bacterium]|nr:DUF420 domain-containing protein [Elusimicrobiota bacterium]